MADPAEIAQSQVLRILETLDRHGVDYLLVGGVSAQAYGARRPTKDLDLVAQNVGDNLGRLADALRELHARLRVGGLTDAESQALPVPVDAQMLARMEISTWRTDAGSVDVLRTDAGSVDVLRNIPARDGTLRWYEALLPRAEEATISRLKVRLASLEDVIASKEWADRPSDRDALPELYQLRAGEEPAGSWGRNVCWVKIPDSTRRSLEARLRRHGRDRWPELVGLRLRFRSNFAYVDGEVADGPTIRLCRLRYGGSANRWGFAMYRASHDDYEDSFLPSGSSAGSPEEALDCACGLYLADPGLWRMGFPG